MKKALLASTGFLPASGPLGSTPAFSEFGAGIGGNVGCYVTRQGYAEVALTASATVPVTFRIARRDVPGCEAVEIRLSPDAPSPNPPRWLSSVTVWSGPAAIRRPA